LPCGYPCAPDTGKTVRPIDYLGSAVALPKSLFTHRVARYASIAPARPIAAALPEATMTARRPLAGNVGQ